MWSTFVHFNDDNSNRLAQYEHVDVELLAM